MASNNPIAEDLIRRTAAYVPDMDFEGADRPSRAKPWAKWLEAELGFRNHWYPAQASRNLLNNGQLSVKLLGEEILMLRRGGRAFAIEDRCCHRGTRFSVRPLCYTDDTITCWHHAFTFNLDDGRIRTLLNDPTSSLVGRRGIKSYPIREVKGVIFIFIGDIAPPPLEADVPLGFFDEDVAICVADPYVVNANWRLGSEGGYDPGHHFIHNWSKYAINARIPMTFGWTSKKEALLETCLYESGGNGPRGFTRIAAETNMAMSATIPGRNGDPGTEVVLPIAAGQTQAEIEMLGASNYATKVGAWLPCGLTVDPWPFPGVVHNEYYVPRDADSHYYFQCGWAKVSSPEQAEQWANGQLGQVRWKGPVVDDFTVQDAEAREGIAKFYAEEDGWQQEQIAAFDIELLMWRVFAGDNCRGIQQQSHTQGLFKR
ncbi:MAG: carbazole 1,9a-dioxygenase terminal dioxygenase component [Gammaproteobacteria bacterium]|jgi:carbazole 1,9a-dioxygenase terminal dioxygenase component